jgi:murein DD-endopeptidase MepM/ murein hydrolase activator NlpD
MKLSEARFDYPLFPYTVSQPFGANATSSYARDGLKGHPAVDFNATFNQPIYSVTRGMGRVYKKFNESNPDLMKYRAPCELVDFDDCTLEITYGHCNDINCSLGQVSKGQQIATAGNTGECYSGGRLVTLEEKKAGSHAGTHLHLQFRKCDRTKKYNLASTLKNAYLLDEYGQIYQENGTYFEYKLDGYNGCIDPMPYLEEKTLVTETEAILKNIETSDISVDQKLSFLKQLEIFFKDWLKTLRG